MFEIALVSLLVAASIPPLYLLSQVSALKKRVEQMLTTSAGPEEYLHTLVAAQRDLVESFDVFDSLLASLQHSRGALNDTGRAFVSTFRERAASYVERGCEGSLLSTHLRQDRLKQLALKLVQEHQADLTHRGYAPVNLDALDNGDFAEYLKLLKYLVQYHLAHIEGVESDRAGMPGLAHVEAL